MRTIFLNFKGYWRQTELTALPRAAGLFCVYACDYDPLSERVLPNRLLYVGESENVRDRLVDGNEHHRWQEFLGKGEELCYTFAPAGHDRLQAQGALIWAHKPPANRESRYWFPWPTTEIILNGLVPFLRLSFIVPETAQPTALPEHDSAVLLMSG